MRSCLNDDWHHLGVQLISEKKNLLYTKAEFVTTFQGESNRIEILPEAFAEVKINDLLPGTSYIWRVLATSSNFSSADDLPLKREYSGRFVTQREIETEASFEFNIVADSHILDQQFKNPRYRNALIKQGKETAQRLRTVIDTLNRWPVDFTVQLGDPFDLHGLGFMPTLSTKQSLHAHATSRRLLGSVTAGGSWFHVMGNWEAEVGCFSDAQIQSAREGRKLHVLNPKPDTYQLGGSEHEDYYAFQWGSLAVIVLNADGYTKTCHRMDSKDSGSRDSFTLGEAQKTWLQSALASLSPTTRFRVAFIHHGLAGNASDWANSQYGRSCHRAAYDGEQRWLHELLHEFGVGVLFYGHDHVFAHNQIDSLHYALVGTTSAPWVFGAAELGFDSMWRERGFANVKVAKNFMRVAYVDSHGKEFHSFQVEALPADFFRRKRLDINEKLQPKQIITFPRKS
jgi:hypothetical protein